MKRIITSLGLALGACSLPQEERAGLEQGVIEAPVVLAEPAMVPAIVPCDINEIAANDGIGGTGCK